MAKQKKSVGKMTDDEYERNRKMLRLLVRTRETFNDVKTATGNRLGLKADGEKQNVSREELAEDGAMLMDIVNDCAAQAKKIEKNLKTLLQRFAFYNEWLEGVKGVGPNHAAWVIGEIDIRHKAHTVSNIWQFAGMNPSDVLGQVSVEKSKYKPEIGEVIGTLPPRQDGGERLRVLTSTLIRGDKMTKGFLCPFNKRLRVALVGRLATSFIRATTPTYYAATFYRPYKARLENSDNITNHKVKGKTEQRAWKDVTLGHRDMAARRFMIKQFLKDVYVQWRTIEGLSVREPYAEEYLGKRHGAAKGEEDAAMV